MTRQTKNYLKKVVLLLSPLFLSLATILAVLLTIELGFRLFSPTSFYPNWIAQSVSKETIFQLDEELIYSMKPNAFSTWETDEFVEKTKTNSLGLRDEEISQKKEKFRILVLGDSFTFGHGVEAEQSYPEQLEHLIKNSQQEEVEVINAGVKGYDLDQEYRFFTTRLIKLKPDLLVVTLGKDDFRSFCNRPLYDLVDGELVPLNTRKTYFYLQIFLYTQAPSWLKESHLLTYILQGLNGRNFFKLSIQNKGRDWQEECPEWSFKKVVKQLEELRRIGIQKGFRLLVVFYPIPEKDESALSFLSDLKEFKDTLWSNSFLFVDANQEKLSLREINSSVVLGEESVNWQKLSFKKDGHLTPQGNEVFAEIVLNSIMKESLLDRHIK